MVPHASDGGVSWRTPLCGKRMCIIVAIVATQRPWPSRQHYPPCSWIVRRAASIAGASRRHPYYSVLSFLVPMMRCYRRGRTVMADGNTSQCVRMWRTCAGSLTRYGNRPPPVLLFSHHHPWMKSNGRIFGVCTRIMIERMRPHETMDWPPNGLWRRCPSKLIRTTLRRRKKRRSSSTVVVVVTSSIRGNYWKETRDRTSLDNI